MLPRDAVETMCKRSHKSGPYQAKRMQLAGEGGTIDDREERRLARI